MHQVAYGPQSTYHLSLAGSPGLSIFGLDMILNAVRLAIHRHTLPKRH
jgi:hypothetical protein